MSSIYIIVAILLVLAIAFYFGYRYVKRKVRGFSQSFFGTDSLKEGWDKQKEELAITPKSVSGMTRIYAPQIQKDFPDFNLEQFKNMVENMLLSAFAAISQGNSSLLKEGTGELKKQVDNQIEMNRKEGIREVYEQIQIHQTEITSYVKRQGTCMITFQSAVGYLHYKEKDGMLFEGEKECLTQTKYNIELMYIQDANLIHDSSAVGTSCPHCGAPITNLGAMYCEYCGLAVTPVNIKVWNLHQFYEVDYHHV